MLVSDAPLPLDTGVLIALAAATGSWDVLDVLSRPVIVTPEVMNELRNGPKGSPGADTPLSRCMAVWDGNVEVSPWFLGVLDKGEASVIALALAEHWPEVGIDEAVGRSVARTSGLRLTGSLGLLIRVKKAGFPLTLVNVIPRIRAAGIWIGVDVEQAALKIAGE